MPTLVESWGGPLSNTYVNLTDADSYITNAIYDSAAWTAATTTQREIALIEATIAIDRANYLGSRYFPDQRLRFPRASYWEAARPFTAVGTPDSVYQVNMKFDVERAACYQALFICRNGGRNPHAENIAAGIKAVSEAVGPIKEFTQYATGSGGGSAQLLAQETIDLLAPYREGRRIFRG